MYISYNHINTILNESISENINKVSEYKKDIKKLTVFIDKFTKQQSGLKIHADKHLKELKSDLDKQLSSITDRQLGIKLKADYIEDVNYITKGVAREVSEIDKKIFNVATKIKELNSKITKLRVEVKKEHKINTSTNNKASEEIKKKAQSEKDWADLKDDAKKTYESAKQSTGKVWNKNKKYVKRGAATVGVLGAGALAYGAYTAYKTKQREKTEK